MTGDPRRPCQFGTPIDVVRWAYGELGPQHAWRRHRFLTAIGADLEPG